MIYLIIFIGLVLRLISLNQSLWLDEATTALVAKMSLGNIFTKFLPGDFHPPLFYLIEKYWTAIFGYSEIALRTPSILFSLGIIYTAYLIAKKIFNKKIALLSAILIATSGLSIYYSQEARMYSLAAFLVSILVYLFLEKKWLLFSIILALLATTDYVSLLIIPIFWFVGLKDWKKMLLAQIPIFLFFIFWSSIFLKQLTSGLSQVGSSWWNLLGPATLKNVALIPVKFIFGRISFDDKALYGIVALAAIILFGFVILKVRKSIKLLWSWLLIPIVLGILLSFKIPTLSYFRFIFCLPALYIIVAAGLEQFTKNKYLLITIFLLINISSSMYYLLTPRFQREDWRKAVDIIGSDTIILPAYSQAEALEYYSKGGQIININNFEGSNREIWLSRYVWWVFDPTDSARKKIEGLGYNKVLESNFNGVVFYKYEQSLAK
jgi:mannosyltransferase